MGSGVPDGQIILNWTKAHSASAAKARSNTACVCVSILLIDVAFITSQEIV